MNKNVYLFTGLFDVLAGFLPPFGARNLVLLVLAILMFAIYYHKAKQNG